VSVDQRIDDDQVLQLGQRVAHLLLVRHGSQRVEALADEAVDLALVHLLEDGQGVVGTVDLGQPVVGEVVLVGRRIAVPGLLQAGEPFREVLREVHLVGPQGLRRALFDIGLAIDVGFGRRDDVTRQARRTGTCR
jgi:hypothetical protein